MSNSFVGDTQVRPLMHLQLPSVRKLKPAGDLNRIRTFLTEKNSTIQTAAVRLVGAPKLNACVTQLADLVESGADSAVWNAACSHCRKLDRQVQRHYTTHADE